MKLSGHYLGLAIALVVGTILRFWNLELKPLWLDEVITALFSLGKSYENVPLDLLLPLNSFREIFTLNPTTNCPAIAQNIIKYSTHPPLFFCLMHAWVESSLNSSVKHSLIWVLRSLPALFGVSAIVSIYYLNRIAFSKKAGLVGAALMAVSPFAIYLSQEARHYTLPLFLINLSLITLIQIQQDIFQQKRRLLVWLAWVIINSIGLYVHYFFVLVILAELATLLVLVYQAKPKVKYLLLSAAFFLLPFLFFLPWLPVFFGHSNRPETDWVPQPEHIIPFVQTLVGWLLMVIILPVESQPLWIAIPAVILMLIFGIWLGWQVVQGMRQLWENSKTNLATLTLSNFTIFVLLELFVIIYILGKDITIAPRYNFVYYPSFCALLAASLVARDGDKRRSTINYLILAGLISCIFVVNGLAFEKPYNPQRVAKNMLQEPSIPLMVVMAYKDTQDIALGLSFALGIDKFQPKLCQNNGETCPKFAFLSANSGYQTVWESLAKLPKTPKLPLNFWIVAPGLKRDNYPEKLAISPQTNCTKDSAAYYRIGVPYQKYKCD
ncbi:glycosyltransferase family 39 protein [Phormidium sp. LEGE 05292]|uniref:glycosyltransferase family 39 protein n=1 Tax=[Phormidium] sp. LEGE 05292 TaxID=767427 RepID=UPI00187E7990|nr:glycosyltransferase family 39 protein [Phormidium sp. LEGE 05292]MBE9227879.1 glycosyltransferase family 39 protein [Phormidium sp. LEGE 05292]